MSGGISIIISAYDSSEFIEECLDSIEIQTYFRERSDFEVFLGIDGCLKTLEIIKKIGKKYRNLRVFMMDSNKGTYVTSNTLLELVKYENILRFDSDDIMNLNMVEELLTANKRLIQFSFDTFGEIKYLDNHISKIKYAGGCVFYKKELIEKYGGYRNWRCSSDSDLINRFLLNGEKIHYIDKKLFKRRIHEGSLTNKEETGRKSQIRKKYEAFIFTSKEKKLDFSEKNTYTEIII